MQNIKKLYTIAFLIVILIGMTKIISNLQFSEKEDLYIYNWGDYIAPELIDKFEAEYNYNVVYETFDSNESMYVKVESGSSPYDLIFPSEYMVDKMSSEGLLKEIDKTKLSNYSNISSQFLNNSFDPNNEYSVPYFWGTVGIVYNTQMYDELGLDYPTSYSDLWNPGLVDNVLLVDGAREIVGSSLNELGYSLNTDDENELEFAKQNLINLKSNVKGVVGDEIKMLMSENEAAAAIVWSGDAKLIMEENENIQFITPKLSNIYLDNIAIPTTSQNEEGAYQFINFLLDPENAQINAEYVGYSSPYTSVINIEENKNDTTFYPSEEATRNLEYYRNLDPETMKEYNDIFLEFKMSL